MDEDGRGGDDAYGHDAGLSVSLALVKAGINGRPATVRRAGWRIYVSVHDAAYLDAKAEWRARLREEHPDHGGSAPNFRRTLKAYQAWASSERTWYAALGLLPPTGEKPAIDPETPKKYQRLRQSHITTTLRDNEYLKIVAEDEGTTVSGLLRLALNRYLASYGKRPLDVLSRARRMFARHRRPPVVAKAFG